MTSVRAPLLSRLHIVLGELATPPIMIENDEKDVVKDSLGMLLRPVITTRTDRHQSLTFQREWCIRGIPTAGVVRAF